MKRTAVLLIVGAVALLATLVGLGLLDVHLLSHGSVGHADRSVDQTLAHHRTGWLNAVTLGVTDSAETYSIAGAALALFVAARLVFKRWREAVFVLCALVGEVTIFVTTTLLVHRARPNVVRLDHAPPTSSFPSGHTAAAVALYGAAAILVVHYSTRAAWRRVAVALAIVLPLAVASSRLYRGMHYPTDVLAGALLGFSWLRISAHAVLDSAVRRVSAVHVPGTRSRTVPATAR
jgi:membrane-associated PAP2 superfamily phosphatase